jgi:hypothetical protein
MARLCVRCGHKMGDWPRDYCSPECWNAQYILACAHCGEPFEPTHSNRRYCSDHCRKSVAVARTNVRNRTPEYRRKRAERRAKRRAERKRRFPKIWAHCGEPFRPVHCRRYCSDDCRQNGRRKLKRRRERTADSRRKKAERERRQRIRERTALEIVRKLGLTDKMIDEAGDEGGDESTGGDAV